jgi:cytochrome c biogenesis factor
MPSLAALPPKVKTLLTSAVSYITLAIVVLTAATPYVANLVDGETAEVVVEWSARAITFLGGVVLIVRRVTPVPPEERGLTPVEGEYKLTPPPA